MNTTSGRVLSTARESTHWERRDATGTRQGTARTVRRDSSSLTSSRPESGLYKMTRSTACRLSSRSNS
jgi:hypothetical protein